MYPLKTCDVCGAPFRPKRDDAKTCSAACRKALSRALKRGSAPKLPKRKTESANGNAPKLPQIDKGAPRVLVFNPSAKRTTVGASPFGTVRPPDTGAPEYRPPFWEVVKVSIDGCMRSIFNTEEHPDQHRLAHLGSIIMSELLDTGRISENDTIALPVVKTASQWMENKKGKWLIERVRLENWDVLRVEYQLDGAPDSVTSNAATLNKCDMPATDSAPAATDSAERAQLWTVKHSVPQPHVTSVSGRHWRLDEVWHHYLTRKKALLRVDGIGAAAQIMEADAAKLVRSTRVESQHSMPQPRVVIISAGAGIVCDTSDATIIEVPNKYRRMKYWAQRAYDAGLWQGDYLFINLRGMEEYAATVDHVDLAVDMIDIAPDKRVRVFLAAYKADAALAKRDAAPEAAQTEAGQAAGKGVETGQAAGDGVEAADGGALVTCDAAPEAAQTEAGQAAGEGVKADGVGALVKCDAAPEAAQTEAGQAAGDGVEAADGGALVKCDAAPEAAQTEAGQAAGDGVEAADGGAPVKCDADAPSVALSSERDDHAPSDDVSDKPQTSEVITMNDVTPEQPNGRAASVAQRHEIAGGVPIYTCQCGKAFIRYALSNIALCPDCVQAVELSHCLTVDENGAPQLQVIAFELDYGAAIDSLSECYDPEHYDVTDRRQMQELNWLIASPKLTPVLMSSDMVRQEILPF
ncbi:MAG: hypothetical protein SNJ80_12540 [Anaerolinea sp.]